MRLQLRLQSWSLAENRQRIPRHDTVRYDLLAAEAFTSVTVMP